MGILLSMLVAVVFELVVISSYEGWAIGWIAQMELLQQERDRASSVIGLWYKMQKATWEREKGAKLHTNNPNAIGPETAHAINMVKRYKQLKEVQFKLKRAEGDYGDAVAESGVSLSDKMANLKTATIGA